MPAFVTTFLTLLTTYWPFLLALGALGTAFNQFASKVFPGTRFANIVNTVTVDFVNLLAEVGGLLGIGPRATPKSKPPLNVLLILAALMLFGCSSFLHFSDPSAQAVSCVIAEGEMPALEAAAALCGPFAPMCESLLETVFGDACTAAAARGASQADAHAAGLAAVQEKAATMREQLNSSDAGAQ